MAVSSSGFVSSCCRFEASSVYIGTVHRTGNCVDGDQIDGVMPVFSQHSQRLTLPRVNLAWTSLPGVKCKTLGFVLVQNIGAMKELSTLFPRMYLTFVTCSSSSPFVCIFTIVFFLYQLFKKIDISHPDASINLTRDSKIRCNDLFLFWLQSVVAAHAKKRRRSTDLRHRTKYCINFTVWHGPNEQTY